MMSVTERIQQSLLTLHMARALETLDHTLGSLEKGEISAIEAIDDLLAEELNLREGWRIDVALVTGRHWEIPSGYRHQCDRSRAGRSVYRCSLAELLEALTRAEREGRLAETIRFTHTRRC